MSRSIRLRIDPTRTHEIDSHFAAVADDYERLAFAGYGRAFVSARELSAVRQALRTVPSGSSVLDVGVGTGRVSRLLTDELGLRTTALDQAEGMLRNARSTATNIGLVGGRANELPFADNRFDAVVAMRLLKWIPRWADAVAEMARVVRPGGIVVLEMANRHSLAALGYRGAPVTLLTSHELRVAVESAGLTTTGWWPGTRLPHGVWALASTPRRASAMGRIERILDPLLGLRGARSIVTTARKPPGAA